LALIIVHTAGLPSAEIARAARLPKADSRGIEGRKEEDAGLRPKGETSCGGKVVEKGFEMTEGGEWEYGDQSRWFGVLDDYDILGGDERNFSMG
jgi:hypothetical protein